MKAIIEKATTNILLTLWFCSFSRVLSEDKESLLLGAKISIDDRLNIWLNLVED